MTLIDQFRFSISLKVTKFKRDLAEFLIKIVTKLEPSVLKKATIGLKMEFELERYVPKDGLWHNVAMTIDFWTKRTDKRKSKKLDTKIYIDGKEKCKCSK